MSERFAIFVVSGDEVVRVGVDGESVTDVRGLMSDVDARCLGIDPHDPSRLYVGTFDHGLYFSADGGERWAAPDGGLEEQRVLSVAVSPSHQVSGVSAVYAGTEPSNLYRSEDGGRRWLRLPALRELPSEPTWSFPPRPWTHHVRTIALHPADPEFITVGIELGGVMRSADAGSSWQDHNSQAHSDAHQLLTHPLAPDRLYEAAGQGIAISEDRGETWSRREDGLDRNYAWATAVDPDDANLWYVSVSRSPFDAHGNGDGRSRLLRSTGNGWAAIDRWGDTPELRRMPYALATVPGRPRHLLAGLRGGTLLLTADAGESWTRLPVQLTDVIAMAVAPA